MSNTVKCNKCGNVIDVGEQLAHDIKESVVLEERKKAQDEVDIVRRKFTTDISKLLDEIKTLREKNEMRDIEMKKKLLESEETIRQDARRKAEEEHQLKDTEKEKLINLKLEEEMSGVRDVVAAGLAVRKEKQVKVRQPLRAVKINRAKKFDAGLEDLIKEELNVKKVLYDITQKETVRQLAELDLELDQALRAEGYTREMMRQIQDMRKEAKYKLNQKVFVQWHSDDKELSDAINEWSENIKRETLLREFLNSPSDKKDYDIQKETDLAPGKKIWVGVKK